jgi:hypothetical protein
MADRKSLSGVGLSAHSLADVWTIQSAAYAAMSEADKTIDYADAQARLDEVGNAGASPPKQRAYESRLRERGGRRLPGGTLQPDAAAALAALLASSYAPSATAAISRALIEAAGRNGGIAE